MIGGTSIFGGRGGYGGTFVGALVLLVLRNPQVLLSAPQPVRDIAHGCIILLVTTAHARPVTKTTS